MHTLPESSHESIENTCIQMHSFMQLANAGTHTVNARKQIFSAHMHETRFLVYETHACMQNSLVLREQSTHKPTIAGMSRN